MTMMKMMYIWI